MIHENAIATRARLVAARLVEEQRYQPAQEAALAEDIAGIITFVLCETQKDRDQLVAQHALEGAVLRRLRNEEHARNEELAAKLAHTDDCLRDACALLDARLMIGGEGILYDGWEREAGPFLERMKDELLGPASPDTEDLL